MKSIGLDVGNCLRATSDIELLNRITLFISDEARVLPDDDLTVKRTVPVLATVVVTETELPEELSDSLTPVLVATNELPLYALIRYWCSVHRVGQALNVYTPLEFAVPLARSVQTPVSLL